MCTLCPNQACLRFRRQEAEEQVTSSSGFQAARSGTYRTTVEFCISSCLTLARMYSRQHRLLLPLQRDIRHRTATALLLLRRDEMSRQAMSPAAMQCRQPMRPTLVLRFCKIFHRLPEGLLTAWIWKLMSLPTYSTCKPHNFASEFVPILDAFWKEI